MATCSSNPDDYISLPIPPVPKTQGLDSTTFKVPPLDGSLMLPEIYDWHLKNSPEHPLFEYADENGVTTLTWAQVVRGVHRAGAYVRLNVAKSSGAQPLDDKPVVSILAYTGKMDI